MIINFAGDYTIQVH